MKRLLIFLFLAALLIVGLVQFGFLRRSNSWLGMKLSFSERDPTLTQVIDPIYQAVFGPNSNMLSVLNAGTSVNNLEQALADARPSEAVNSARRLCGIMQNAVTHAGEMQERRDRNAVVPHGSITPGDSRKASDFFSEVIKRDWRARYSELQAGAVREWARIQALEQAGDRPLIDASALPTPIPAPQ
jgi:hypothetical protein